ncbi:hypothetical protein AVEN_236691-1 [Araneus ventricosus]|uniref:Uncharacterized protein n=1 Tax=Araneus ventricosus TaxID=182803 RepID=A0A4Y2JHA3_ARAVE|nr:hypothetical protein AVEN_266330-1 [Araneus ventricosus]GBM88795.1 hypothetical protein AVEN_111560-1 [Araneus ventricosus]GBM88803.1 hypothetical protein AVEN_137639-1 [Araneus ventricosus]GBM88848.1 hypothetical protein AVEN_274816-1 [Araneus ventricosus]GBM88865.1 hypothetical protein AVEN_236691-1 [Araneus ventricosus]
MSKEEDDDLRSGASEYPISMESDGSNANGRASPMKITQIPQTCHICAIQTQHSRYISVLTPKLEENRKPFNNMKESLCTHLRRKPMFSNSERRKGY